MAREPLFDRPEILAMGETLRRQSQKIAEMDFRLMLEQLKEGRFLYRTDGAAAAVSPGAPPMPRGVRARPISPPLGSIAWAPDADALPAIGIAIDSAAPDALARSLTALFWQHHTAPLGRMVFVTEMLPLLPFLGRFGFAYWAAAPDEAAFQAIARRFGVVQVRRLSDATVCWTALAA